VLQTLAHVADLPLDGAGELVHLPPRVGELQLAPDLGDQRGAEVTFEQAHLPRDRRLRYKEEVLRFFPLDQAKARGLLAAAGWDANTNVEFKFPASPKSQLLAEVIQRQLAAVGIKTTLMPQDQRTVWPTVQRNAEFQMACAEQLQTSSDPDQWLRGGWGSRGLAGGGNQARWSDPEVDALITKEQGEPDLARRKEIILGLQRLILQKSAPAINLYAPYNLTARWDHYHPADDRGSAGIWGHYSWIG
jgi:ABC-type transport system substrate-binding protein